MTKYYTDSEGRTIPEGYHVGLKGKVVPIGTDGTLEGNPGPWNGFGEEVGNKTLRFIIACLVVVVVIASFALPFIDSVSLGLEPQELEPRDGKTVAQMVILAVIVLGIVGIVLRLG